MTVGPVTRASAAYLSNATGSSAPEPTAKPGFADKLDSAVQSVDKLQFAADEVLTELASAEQVDLHGTMIALEKADIALRTMVSVRDKCIAAYEQVMNMAI